MLHQLFLLAGLQLLKVSGGAGLHLLEPEALLGLGIGKCHLLLCGLCTSHRLADAKASTDDAMMIGIGPHIALDPHELKEQPTLCSEIGMRRDEGEPHPPQPLDMHHVTSICEIEKDPVPLLHPVEMNPGFPQEPHGVKAITHQVVSAQHPDGTDVRSLWHDAPHAHGPAVPADHGHAGVPLEEAVQQGLLGGVARERPHL
jgi:hypothetical protein